MNQLSTKKLSAENIPCYRSGGVGHTPARCKFKKSRCYNCNKIGHIAKVCRSGDQKQAARSVKQITTVNSEMMHDAVNNDQYDLYDFSTPSKHHPLQVSLEIEGQRVIMEIDTGASASVSSGEEYHRRWPGVAIPGTNIQLRTYTGE